MLLSDIKRALIISPHADDEILGVGGTAAKLTSQNVEVYVAVASKGRPPMFPEPLIEETIIHCLDAHKELGIKETFFLDEDDMPAARLDQVGAVRRNSKIRQIIEKIDPQLLFVPFPGDIHLDHKLIFESSMVAIRPNGQKIPDMVLSYETLSETNWEAPYLSHSFQPNVFIDISDHLEQKLSAFSQIKSQVKPFPNERSLKAIEALAIHRGAMAGIPAAEGFVLIRSIQI